jgi:hypothetical protein
MAPGIEVAFLRKRTGFVRLALQQGVPLVPAFAFGQTDMYRWIRPGPPLVPVSWINALSRAVGDQRGVLLCCLAVPCWRCPGIAVAMLCCYAVASHSRSTA